MFDPLRLPHVFQSTAQSRNQYQLLIGGAQQNRSAIGTALPLIKLGRDWTLNNSWKENTFVSCYARSNESLFNAYCYEEAFVFLNSRTAQANT
ncbi:MAG: hypothetical protein WCA49_05545 [Candidatus Sulfotelmatobacter sp.]